MSILSDEKRQKLNKKYQRTQNLRFYRWVIIDDLIDEEEFLVQNGRQPD